MKIFINLIRFFEIDRPTFYLIGSRVWAALAGLISTALIAVYFPPSLQGYFYTFSSVVALKILAELGMGVVIISFVSHEWSSLSMNKNGDVVGDSEAFNRLLAIGGFAFRWFAYAGAVTFILLLFVGWIFFSSSNYSNSINWQSPWFLLCLFTGLGIILLPVWTLLEGCNQTEKVYSFRFKQIILSNLGVWCSIFFEIGLWALVVAAAIEFFYALFVINKSHKIFFKLFLRKKSGSTESLNWKKTIFPMQWRMSLSWISGYLSFYIITPVLFYFHGPVVAGKMGMTWMLVNGLTSVVSAWVTPKAPVFGVLISQKKYDQLDALFWRLMKIVFVASLCIATGIWITTYLIFENQLDLSKKILEPLPTLILLIATVILNCALPMAVYLRSHRSEPLLAISVFGGLLNALLLLILGKYYSAVGASVGYLTVTIFQLPFVIYIWLQKRKEWHYVP